MSNKYIKLDNWVENILVDPLDKSFLEKRGNYLISSYGKKYRIIEGIYDLRILKGNTSNNLIWKKGQKEYENLSKKNSLNDKKQNYELEREIVSSVYKEIPIVGRCLDVGGHLGLLRAFIDENQEYISIDPYLDVFKNIEERVNLIKTYPFLLKPVNFICGFGEHLPFKSKSFDTVHIRSVIDHMYNPELALLESYRVLKNNGHLIIGSYVEGGKSGKKEGIKIIKDLIKSLISVFSKGFEDHHVWHPTYKQLSSLVETCGFKIDLTHWQQGYNNHVCYIKAKKITG